MLMASTTVIVPVGHTLKIEDVRQSFYNSQSGLTSLSNNWGIWVTLDDVIISERRPTQYTTSNGIVDQDQPPIWLPSGSYVFDLYAEIPAAYPVGIQVEVKGFISAIQFAIMP